MRLRATGLLICAASLALLPLQTTPASGYPAGAPVVTLVGNIAFLSSDEGWIELSSSAGYSPYCYQATPQPAACNRASTSIYATGDGGRTWRRILHFTGNPLIGPDALPTAWMHRFDAQHALIIPAVPEARGTLYRTTDGGGRWTAHSLPGPVRYFTTTDVAFADQRHLWLLDHVDAAMGSEVVRVYRTRDAGSHWSLVACTTWLDMQPGNGCRRRSGIGIGGHKDNIMFANPSTGFLVNNNNSGIPFLYVTHDGGAHWHIENPGLPRGVPAPNPKTGVFPYAELQQPLFFGTLGILPTTASVCRPRRPHGSSDVCSSGFYALLSHDGGRTWPVTRRFPFVTGHQMPVWQAMSATAWRAITGTRAWSTNDAGAHWTAIHATMPRGYTPVVMQFATPATGWAIAARFGRQGGIIRSTRLLRTDDGGRHWSVISLPGPS